MKFTRIILLLSASLFVCGYTNYFVSDSNAVEKLYGKKSLVNMVEGKTEVFNKDNDFSCKGMLFIVQPNSSMNDEKKLYAGMPFSRIKCSDNRVIELKWNQNMTVSGVDQYKKDYQFRQVKRKEYKNYTKNAFKPEKKRKNDGKV